MIEIEKLNRGEYVVTYKMVQVQPDHKPVTGEIRYLMPLIPSPSEPLASMMLSDPICIVWDSVKWQAIITSPRAQALLDFADFLDGHRPSAIQLELSDNTAAVQALEWAAGEARKKAQAYSQTG